MWSLFVMKEPAWCIVHFTENDQVFLAQEADDQLKLKIFAILQPHFPVPPTVPAIPPLCADGVHLSCLLVSLESHHPLPTGAAKHSTLLQTCPNQGGHTTLMGCESIHGLKISSWSPRFWRLNFRGCASLFLNLCSCPGRHSGRKPLTKSCFLSKQILEL